MRREPLLAVGVLLCLLAGSGHSLGQVDPDVSSDCVWETVPFESSNMGFTCFTLDTPLNVMLRVDGEPCSGSAEQPPFYYMWNDVIPALYRPGMTGSYEPGTYFLSLDAGTQMFNLSYYGTCIFCDEFGDCSECYTWPSIYPQCPDWRYSVTPITAVEIEIIPRKVSPFSPGVIPVAVLGSEQFDVSLIDVTTLGFGPANVGCKHDLTDPWIYNEHVEDMNADGFMDLMLHFTATDTGIVCGETSALLMGVLVDGTPFGGMDAFTTVGCNTNRPQLGLTDRGFERMQRQQSPRNTEEQQHPGDLVEEQKVD